MKQGQFFMVGTIVLAGLIFGVVSITSSSADTSIDLTPQKFFENVQNEFPKVIGHAIERNNDIDTIEQEARVFMRYVTFTEQQRGLDSTHYLMVGLPTDDGYNVTLGNFNETTMTDVTISVGNESETINTLEQASFTQVSLSPGSDHFTVMLNASLDHSFETGRNAFALLHSRSETRDAVWQDTKISR